MARDEIAGYYRQILGREPDQAGLDYWANAVNNGITLAGVAGGIARSNEADQRRAQAAQSQARYQEAANQLSGYQGQISNYQSQISGFERQLNDYQNQVSGLQNQYNDALGQVQTWQSKAGEFEASARDWEDQFSTKSQEYEAARDEAERYRNEAVGQQLRALKAGTTSGGSNSTTQQGGLAGGRTQYQPDREDGVEIDKGIKAESGLLSNKGAVVQRINTDQRRQRAPETRPNQGLASGSTSGYYASRFG
jgi:chromosome segregation ATPase